MEVSTMFYIYRYCVFTWDGIHVESWENIHVLKSLSHTSWYRVDLKQLSDVMSNLNFGQILDLPGYKGDTYDRAVPQ